MELGIAHRPGPYFHMRQLSQSAQDPLEPLFDLAWIRQRKPPEGGVGLGNEGAHADHDSSGAAPAGLVLSHKSLDFPDQGHDGFDILALFSGKSHHEVELDLAYAYGKNPPAGLEDVRVRESLVQASSEAVAPGFRSECHAVFTPPARKPRSSSVRSGSLREETPMA